MLALTPDDAGNRASTRLPPGPADRLALLLGAEGSGLSDGRRSRRPRNGCGSRWRTGSIRSTCRRRRGRRVRASGASPQGGREISRSRPGVAIGPALEGSWTSARTKARPRRRRTAAVCGATPTNAGGLSGARRTARPAGRYRFRLRLPAAGLPGPAELPTAHRRAASRRTQPGLPVGQRLLSRARMASRGPGKPGSFFSPGPAAYETRAAGAATMAPPPRHLQRPRRELRRTSQRPQPAAPKLPAIPHHPRHRAEHRYARLGPQRPAHPGARAQVF